MKSRTNKITFLTAVFFMLLIILSFGSYNSIEAGNNHNDNDNCGTETYTFDRDGSNSKVEVDFESNDRQIDVFGRNGWSVTKVELEVEDDNNSGFWQYSTGPLNNFNPNPGNRINRARVTVTKQCPTSTPRNTPRPTPSVTPTSTPVPTQTATSVPSATPTATPVATVSPTAVPTDDPCEIDCNEPTITPVPTVVPTNDVCENIDGIQTNIPDGKHLDASGKNCVEYSQAGAPEPKDSGIGGAEVLGVSTGQVLGVSTMAATGAVEDAIFNSIFTLGSILTSFGIMKNGKKVRN